MSSGKSTVTSSIDTALELVDLEVVAVARNRVI